MIRQEEVYKIGKLGKTHGVKGEISFLFDDDVFDRTDADYLILEIDGILVPFFIEEYRFKTDSNALMKFDGIDTQERARELTGCDVYFRRDMADEDSEHLSWAELISMKSSVPRADSVWSRQKIVLVSSFTYDLPTDDPRVLSIRSVNSCAARYFGV